MSESTQVISPDLTGDLDLAERFPDAVSQDFA